MWLYSTCTAVLWRTHWPCICASVCENAPWSRAADTRRYIAQRHANANCVLATHEEMATQDETTVFGKHCECIAQKCTHLKRLPPLASQLLLLSHCVLTQHGGQKKALIGVRFRDSNQGRGIIQSKDQPSTLFDQSYPMGHVEFANNDDLFKVQITTFAENGKIQSTPKITNHLFTLYLNCMASLIPFA